MWWLSLYLFFLLYTCSICMVTHLTVSMLYINCVQDKHTNENAENANETKQNTKLLTYIMMTGDIFPLQACFPIRNSVAHSLALPFSYSLSLSLSMAFCSVFLFYFALSHLVVVFYYTFTVRENECVFSAVYACCFFFITMIN